MNGRTFVNNYKRGVNENGKFSLVKEYRNNLSDNEKISILKNTFQERNYIENIGDYLAENFKKIDGFNYKWNSLITSKPLLFEDIDYLRVKQHINNTITDEEIKAFKDGKLRELYATFENMLICNLQYYDRILSFCTMVFLKYIRINDEELTTSNLDDIPYILDMTPTQIWCCALTNTLSTEWELNYAWKVNNKDLNILPKTEDKSVLEVNWNLIYKNNIFSRFVEYASYRKGTNGFKNTIISDKASNHKLAQICAKFTKTSMAISTNHLNTIIDYITEQETINKKLYKALNECLNEMFNGDDKQFAVYVYSNEYYIHSSRFSMKVVKSDKGKITKEYLANSFECFAAEEYLIKSVKIQIEWAKYKLPIKHDFDKSTLKILLKSMLDEDFKKISCIKRMNDYGVISEITFKGIFGNVYIIENLIFNNTIIKTYQTCLSKENASNYIIDRGYYIFGNNSDILKFLEINKTAISEHYLKYCIPVIHHMKDIIELNNIVKNQIIDFVCGDKIPKLNNENIRYSRIKYQNINSKQIMQMLFEKQKSSIEKQLVKKSYWKVINE